MLMTAQSFSEAYDYNRQTVESWLQHKKDWVIKKDNKLFVDVDAYFGKIYAQSDLRIRAQQYFFYFTHAIGVYASFVSDRLSRDLGGTVDTWNSFLSYTIWSDGDNRKDSERLTRFLHWCEDELNAYKYGAYMFMLGTKHSQPFLERLREMI